MDNGHVVSDEQLQVFIIMMTGEIFAEDEINYSAAVLTNLLLELQQLRKEKEEWVRASFVEDVTSHMEGTDDY